jgi:hypothetical protein
MNALDVYTASDGELTTRYYSHLQEHGPVGIVAVNLFRAQKNSERAKKYRGGIRGQGSYKSMAYDRKSWAMGNLCGVLAEHAAALSIRYGWKQDPAPVFGQAPSWVLYVDLPQGQCSFHSPHRGAGPDYPGDWDRKHKSVERILAFCDAMGNAAESRTAPTAETAPTSRTSPARPSAKLPAAARVEKGGR